MYRTDFTDAERRDVNFIKREILEQLETTHDLSFTHLEYQFHVEQENDMVYTWGPKEYPNISYWETTNKAIRDAVSELDAEKKIKLEPCNVFLYMIDGGRLNLPVVKRIPKNGYKEPHWLPVLIMKRSKE